MEAEKLQENATAKIEKKETKSNEYFFFFFLSF
jgi:hypothetical protein